jgi:6,7-dimethyl-8-ribityllumazine synthase
VVRVIEPGPFTPTGRVVIVCSRYNSHVTEALLAGALEELKAWSVGENAIDIVRVPGAFELPTAAKLAAAREDTSAVLCLGAVIRGETPHFDIICRAAAIGIMRAGQDSGKPVTFGVITADTPAQAFERAGGQAGNKGAEAARAAMELLSVFKRWET